MHIAFATVSAIAVVAMTAMVPCRISGCRLPYIYIYYGYIHLIYYYVSIVEDIEYYTIYIYIYIYIYIALRRASASPPQRPTRCDAHCLDASSSAVVVVVVVVVVIVVYLSVILMLNAAPRPGRQGAAPASRP